LQTDCKRWRACFVPAHLGTERVEEGFGSVLLRWLTRPPVDFQDAENRLMHESLVHIDANLVCENFR
jgi:hypothetical protein